MDHGIIQSLGNGAHHKLLNIMSVWVLHVQQTCEWRTKGLGHDIDYTFYSVI